MAQIVLSSITQTESKAYFNFGSESIEMPIGEIQNIQMPDDSLIYPLIQQFMMNLAVNGTAMPITATVDLNAVDGTIVRIEHG